MALTEPLDLLTDFPGWSTDFDFPPRQEQSRHANGRVRTKDFGSPIWTATWVSRTLSPNTLDYWRVRLRAAMLDQMTFWAWPSSRCRPIKHPGSGALPAGTVSSINADGKSIGISGLSDIALSIGDFVQIGDADLHVVLSLGTQIELRPHLWPGAGTGDAVRISKPRCLMTIMPGSISAQADPRTGRGSISFQGIEARG